jgi:hypothetical protein
VINNKIKARGCTSLDSTMQDCLNKFEKVWDFLQSCLNQQRKNLMMNGMIWKKTLLPMRFDISIHAYHTICLFCFYSEW